MSTKITKTDAKTPDQVTQSLKQGFVWTTAHSKMILGGMGAFIALGAIFSTVNYLSQRKEKTQQEKYYVLEKNYLDKKRGFEEFEQAELMKATAKDPKKLPEIDISKKPTGDFNKDYGSIISGFEQFISEYPGGHAAQMAALNLSEIYASNKKLDEAFSSLEKVEKSLDKNDMISALVWMQMGNLLANKKDCKGAIEKWQNLLNNKTLSFSHGEAKLRMGLCYESLNEVAKAEEIYNDLGNNSSLSGGNPEVAREAKKYLRLIKAQKNL